MKHRLEKQPLWAGLCGVLLVLVIVAARSHPAPPRPRLLSWVQRPTPLAERRCLAGSPAGAARTFVRRQYLAEHQPTSFRMISSTPGPIAVTFRGQVTGAQYSDPFTCTVKPLGASSYELMAGTLDGNDMTTRGAVSQEP